MTLAALFEKENKRVQSNQRNALLLEDQTVYTVETTLTSIRREDVTLEKRKTKKKSKKKLKGTSSSSSSSTLDDCKVKKRVHFGTMMNTSSTGFPDDSPEHDMGDIQCDTRIVERFDDDQHRHDLWYSRNDVKSMRQEGLLTAYAMRQQVNLDAFCFAALKVLQPGAGRDESKENGRQFMHHLAAAADLRGLESYLAPQINQVVQSQIKATLAAQATTKDPAVIRLEARRVSKRCTKMARQLAMHDTKEALKASFSSWRRAEEK